MLFDCSHVESMWTELREKMRTYLVERELDWSTKQLILNSVHPKPRHLVNFMILVMKQIIHRHKCLGTKVTYQDFENEIRTFKEIEYYCARTVNKMSVHRKKWLEYDDITCRPNNTNSNIDEATQNFFDENVTLNSLPTS